MLNRDYAINVGWGVAQTNLDGSNPRIVSVATTRQTARNSAKIMNKRRSNRQRMNTRYRSVQISASHP